MRRWLILGLSAATAMLAVGCGSSSQSVPPSELQSSAETEETSTAPSTEESQPEESGGPLSYVGTITGSDGKGTTFSNDYRVGPLLYSDEETPPEAVLNACRINDPTHIASSVFARGQVTTTYQEGSLPTSVILLSWEELAQGLDIEGEKLFLITAFRLDGEWRCNSETESSVSIEFQPGESQTVPIWVIGPQVLTNAQPRLPASVLNTWYFKFIGSVYGYTGSLTIHGPGTGSCGEEIGEEQRLLLFNRTGHC